MASSASLVPFVPFVLGIGAIFLSGGSLMIMAVGDLLVFVSGVAFIKAMK